MKSTRGIKQKESYLVFENFFGAWQRYKENHKNYYLEFTYS